MKIVLILFSFIVLYASVNIKYIPYTKYIYLYIKEIKKPKNIKFPQLKVDNANLIFIKKFSYFHNGYYYIGKVYKIDVNNFEIKPLNIIYNNKSHFTKPFIYKKIIKDLNINVSIKEKKSHFFRIIEVFIIVYIFSLIIIYNLKKIKLKETLGMNDNNIKKFYYYLAINNFKEVEELNKIKNLFKKDIEKNQEINIIYTKILNKLLQKQTFIKEIYIWIGILLIIFFIEAKI